MAAQPYLAPYVLGGRVGLRSAMPRSGGSAWEALGFESWCGSTGDCDHSESRFTCAAVSSEAAVAVLERAEWSEPPSAE